MPRSPVFALLALAASLSMTAPASAAGSDCPAAGTGRENAVCGEPELANAEAAMRAAFALLRAELPQARRAALQLDQEVWARARKAACGDKRDGPLAHCLLDLTQARRHMLAGEGRNGPSPGSALEPAFFREARQGGYEIEIAYPQLQDGAGPSAAFNRAAHDFILADGKLMAQFRGAGSGSSLTSVFYDLVYFDRHLATVVFWIVSMNPGWTHPFTARESLAFDLSRGRQLAPSDVVLAPERAVGAIAAKCRDRLADQASRDGWSLMPRSDPLAVVDDFRNWAPGAFALDILFDPGSLPAQAAGPRSCRLDYGSIGEWLRRDGPLPPK